MWLDIISKVTLRCVTTRWAHWHNKFKHSKVQKQIIIFIVVPYDVVENKNKSFVGTDLNVLI